MGKSNIPLVGPLLKPIDRATMIGKTSTLPFIASAIGGPIAGAATAGATDLAEGRGFGQAIGDAAGNYIGGQLGGAGNVGPSGTIASTLGSLGSIGSYAANALPASIAGSSIGGAAGSFLGGNIGGAVGGSLFDKAASPQSPTASGPPPFMPSQSAQMALPPSLSQFGSLNPVQQSTNIATQGVYGGGEGPQENKYFLNLINRRLVDDQGHVGNLSSLQPVEQSYLSQLGLGGYTNPNDLLKGISTYSG